MRLGFTLSLVNVKPHTNHQANLPVLAGVAQSSDRAVSPHAGRASQRTNSMNESTPWGRADHCRPIATGIVWYSTPSHGGYYLSPVRRDEMPASLRAISPWAGEGWYEEDCDWAIVVASFPDLFTAKDRYHAARTLPCISYAASAAKEFQATEIGAQFFKDAMRGQDSDIFHPTAENMAA